MASKNLLKIAAFEIRELEEKIFLLKKEKRFYQTKFQIKKFKKEIARIKKELEKAKIEN